MDVCTSLMTVCHVAYLHSSALLAQTRPTMVKQLWTSLAAAPPPCYHSLSIHCRECNLFVGCCPSHNPSKYFMLFKVVAKQHPTTIYECWSRFCIHAAYCIHMGLDHLHFSCVPGPKSVTCLDKIRIVNAGKCFLFLNCTKARYNTKCWDSCFMLEMKRFF